MSAAGIAIVVVLIGVLAYWWKRRRHPLKRDCPSGQTRSRNGDCVVLPHCGTGPPCAPPAVCIGGKCATPPPTPCGMDNPCNNPLEVCDDASGVCTPACGIDRHICPSPGVCFNGSCIGACKCARSDLCINRKCVPFSKNCVFQPCKFGEICTIGQCIPLSSVRRS